MSIIAGYTKQSNGEHVTIGAYDNPSLAEAALDADTSSDVKEYWIASFINPETDEPDILGLRDV